MSEDTHKKSQWGARLAHLLLWAPVLAYAAVVARHFFRVTDTAITLSTDDALANISYALATTGRYGFLSSPVLEDMARDRGLFSYGPFYFYVGAALIWIFGYSLTLLRAIHLAVMLAIAAAGRWWFRPVAAGAAGVIVAVGVLQSLDVAQWPMVRPDSFVSLFAVAFVVCAGLGLRTGWARYWVMAGFAAACGALTHLVAWSLVPASLVTILIAVLADAQDAEGRWRRPALPWKAVLGTATGGVAGAFLFYASFGFRFRDQVAFIAGYQKLTGSMGAGAAARPTFGALLLEHFNRAYWYLPWPLDKVVWATFGAGMVFVLMMLWGARASRREALATVAPPVVVWAGYFLSLGVYNNFHSGYALLNIVMWLWTLAALAQVLVQALERRWPVLGTAAGVGLWGLGAALGVGMLTVLGSSVGAHANEERTFVPIGQYSERVLAPLPARARAWGTVQFGIENPDRLQLIQFWEAMRIATASAPAERLALAPDYIVWGAPENAIHVQMLSGALTPPVEAGKPMDLVVSRALAGVFPSLEYVLVSMTAGEPYGVTRVYARRDGVPDLGGPVFSVYDAVKRQWNSGLSAPTALAAQPAPRGHMQVGPDLRSPVVDANQTVTASLPEGLYLLRVTLSDVLTPDRAVMITATAKADIRDASEQYGGSVDVGPWFSGERAVYLLYQHTGDALFVSQFGNGAPAIAGVAAQRVGALADYKTIRRGAATRHPIGVADWKPFHKAITLKAAADGGTEVEGDTILYGYQAVGPVIAVKPGDRLQLTIPVTVAQGKACLGVLDEEHGRWVVAPYKLDPQYEFPITASSAVRPVLADCSVSAEAISPMRATIGPGTWALWSDRDELYTDVLMRAREEALKRQ